MEAEWSHFPVEGCSVLAVTRTSIRVQLWHQNVWDTVVIMEDGNLPHSKSPLWDMLIPCQSLDGLKNSTAQFNKESERKRRRLTVKGARAVTSRVFSAYGRPLEMAPYFKYLGRVI